MIPAGGSPVVHLELHTPDRTRARALYTKLFGWRSERIDALCGSYLALELGRGIGGGIVECGTERALWLPYVEVAEIVQTTDRARRLGSSVLLAPRRSGGLAQRGGHARGRGDRLMAAQGTWA
ncbi:MAG: VOC family protein [Solirubrobacteraceae bacterium]